MHFSKKIVLLLIKTMASQQIEMLCGEQKEKKSEQSLGIHDTWLEPPVLCH